MRRHLLSLLPLLLVVACGGRHDDASRAAIEDLLAAYPERLSRAYAEGSVVPLSDLVTPREAARVTARIEELAATGQALRARLVERRLIGIELHRATAAIAEVIEVWNLQVVAVGSETPLSESPAQENELVYSLIRDEGRWQVLSRMLRQSSEPLE